MEREGGERLFIFLFTRRGNILVMLIQTLAVKVIMIHWMFVKSGVVLLKEEKLYK